MHDTDRMNSRLGATHPPAKTYRTEQIDALLAACNSDVMRVAINVLRMSGLREQDAVHLQWSDVDLRHGVIRVRSKPADGFKIKDRSRGMWPSLMLWSKC
jgi:integrase